MCLYVPWLLVAAGSLIMDAIAVVTYVGDIMDIQSVKTFFEFVGIEIPTIVEIENLVPTVALQIPSILMTVILARFGLIWIVNLILFITVLVNCIKVPGTIRAQKTRHGAARPNPVPYLHDDRIKDPRYPPQQQQPHVLPQLQAQPYHSQLSQNISETAPNNYRGPSPPQEHWLNGPKPTRPSFNGQDRGGDRFQPRENSSRNSITPNQKRLSSQPSTPVSPEVQPQYNRKGILRPTSEMGTPSPFQQAANINNDRQSSIPPAELRSQLPWSYFQTNQPIGGIRRNFNKLPEDEDLPPVPVPDYTLHFPKKRHRQTDDDRRGHSPTSSGS